MNRQFAIICALVPVFLVCARLEAHFISFNSTITYLRNPPAGTTGSISNWTGAAFDAGNVGGSGVNADGGANNGTANDGTTYVANNQPRQGQTITTGSAANGYDLMSITVRMAGYTNNIATGANRVLWDLNFQNGPIIVGIGKVSGTNFSLLSYQNFSAGGTGNPGAGSSSNGPGTYITFDLPFKVHLEPNTTYGFDFVIGNGGANHFEWLGTNADVFLGGTAYTRSGGTITPRAGDRVFILNLVESAAPSTFVHPGTLHSPADLARMRVKLAANAQPWRSGYDILAASPYAQTGWPAAPVAYIVRGGTGQNYTRSQEDAQAIYELALRWHITGNAVYANRAVEIANVWADTLVGVTGDSNLSLAAGICGYLFAIGGDLLSTYSGWADADKAAYKEMMMRVFYPANFDFLWRHHDTFWREGGNTHYRLNWDTFNIASMAAIGVLCDNRAVYEQALDFFKYGPGNGRIERAGWYIHADGLAQGEEAGRDQGHNLTGWNAMAYLCQIAWNQGDDLYTYDNSRVLRALEYNAKFNLGYGVPSVPHRNTDLDYTEGGVSGAGRGIFVPTYEQIYNHYVHVLGVAAPYSKLVADLMRPEPRPNRSIHPSQLDWFGLGTLTFTRDPIATSAPPRGLRAHWSKNAVRLYWWGSAYATNYNIKRAVAPGGPYSTIGTTGALDMTFRDTDVANGSNYFYVVSALTPAGETANSAELAVGHSLVAHYTLEGNANDVAGTRHGTLLGGSSGGPTFTTGKIGQAASFDGGNDYVQLPTGSGNYQDITIGAWVYWNGGGNWQRVFDFGSEIEKNMFLTPKSSAGAIRFHMTTTRGFDGSVTLNGPVMPTATWTHLAVTLNGDAATLYFNGVPVDSEVASVIDPLFGQPFCYLGRSMWNSDPYFSGRIDDFRIYNYALSGADVYNLWGQSANSPPIFSNDPLTKPAALEDATYAETLAGSAMDTNGGPLRFSKVTGPAWLSISADGALSGVPLSADVGVNLFVVRVTDFSGATDDANLYITVRPARIALSPTFVPAGTVWRYFDKTNDMGSAWRSNSFSDVTWSNGLARLGFGNDGEATKVASNRQWTTYFRRQFYVPNPTNVTALQARLTRDDAAVLYLNGAEIWRDTNITSGTITYTTPALTALGRPEETNWLTLSLEASTFDYLVTGTNLLAAEVHNQSQTSSDIGFDLELSGDVVLASPPALGAAVSGGVLVLTSSADAAYFRLFATTNLAEPAAWTTVTNTAVLSNDTWSTMIPVSLHGQRFFRLQAP